MKPITNCLRYVLLALPLLFFTCKDKDPGPDTDDVVYIAGQSLYALDAATGNKRWTYSIPGPSTSFSEGNPTVTNGVVYCVGHSFPISNQNSLNAINAATGTLKWQVTNVGNFMSGPPVVANDLVYISGGAFVYALDTNTGTVRWKANPFGTNDTGNPAVANGLVYVTSYSKCMAFDAITGALKWTFTMDTDSHFRTPIISGGSLYVGSGGTYYALDATTGASKWMVKMSAGSYATDPPVVVDGVGYVGDVNGNLQAIDPATGMSKWTKTGLMFPYMPSVGKSLLYVATINPFRIVAVSVADGSTKWEVKLPDFSSGSPTLSNGTVYVGNQQKGLYAIDAVTGTVKWTAASLGNTIYSNPCVVTKNGKVVLPGIGN
ncbi:outer membrane protein assembly factor BamB family protein [Fibrella arboris]|uniref:outer membrane protein assembly factor BamB family protein n=1 Tax=Fibrella arboris TaxID=3242486 RepID=UPI00352183B9